MSKPHIDVDAYYRTSISNFKRSLQDAQWTSRQAIGLDAGERRYWSSVLLVRLCCIGQSMLTLCPDSDNPTATTHWDFASVGSIARNLFECGMFFRYFSTRVDDSEWLTRLNLMQLHDCTERIRMFGVIDDAEEVKGFEGQAQDLRNRLSSHSFFQSLDPKFQKQLLQGNRASLFSLSELVATFVDDKQIWFVYQFLSSHTHSLPLSFYRTWEQKRNGVENEVDKGYISMAMELATDTLNEAVKAFRDDLDTVVKFAELPKRQVASRMDAPRQSKKLKASKPDRNAECPCGSGQKFRWCHGADVKFERS
jgi:Family of unknown function (DUF5677)/SEC-C motif